MSSSRHRNYGRIKGGSERVCEGYGLPNGRHVNVRAAFFEIKLQVRADTYQIKADKRHPVPQGTAHAKELVVRKPLPAANLFGRALAKANLVAVVPPAFGGIARVFPVNSGLEQYLG